MWLVFGNNFALPMSFLIIMSFYFHFSLSFTLWVGSFSSIVRELFAVEV
jgi:hypothetical protein